LRHQLFSNPRQAWFGMSGLEWYPRNSRKALKGMQGLSLELRGAYNTLIDLIYDRGEPVPDDDRWLAGQMGVSVRKWKQLRADLLAAGRIIARAERKGPVLSDELAEKELENQTSRRRLNAESGAKGGRKSAETRAVQHENNDLPEATARATAQATLKRETVTETGTEENHTASADAIDKPFLDGLEASLRKAAGPAINAASPGLMIVAPILGLLRPGDGPACDLEADVLPALRSAAAKSRPGAAQTWAYFVPAIVEARDRRLSGAGPMALAAKAKPEDWPESRWTAAVQIFAEDGRWSETCGPEPGKPGCRAPLNVLIAGGFGGEGTVVPFEPRTDRSAA
jgi:uncharacterized protein YdaU (DUF1376 family)